MVRVELTHYIDEESCEDESSTYLILDDNIIPFKYDDTVRVSNDAIERAGYKCEDISSDREDAGRGKIEDVNIEIESDVVKLKYDVRVSIAFDVVFLDLSSGESMKNVLLKNVDEKDIISETIPGDPQEYYACVNGLENPLISENGGYLPAEVTDVKPTREYDVKYVVFERGVRARSVRARSARISIISLTSLTNGVAPKALEHNNSLVSLYLKAYSFAR